MRQELVDKAMRPLASARLLLAAREGELDRLHAKIGQFVVERGCEGVAVLVSHQINNA